MGRSRLRLLALSVTCLVYLIANIKTITGQKVEIEGLESLASCGHRPGYKPFVNRGKRIRTNRIEDISSTSPIHMLDGDLLDHSNGGKFSPEHGHSRKSQVRSKRVKPKQGGHVAGGFIAEAGQFPSYVGLSKSPYWRQVHCGGTLLGRQLVITASNCLVGDPLYVITGLNSPDRKHLDTYEVVRQCTSRRFCNDENEPYSLSGYDFTLLELKKPVRYTKYIQPACFSFLIMGHGFYEMAGMGEFANLSLPDTLLYGSFRANCSQEVLTSDTELKHWIDCYNGTEWTHACSGDAGSGVYSMGRVGSSERQFVLGAVSYPKTTECNLDPDDATFATSFRRLDIKQEMIDTQRRTCTTNLTEEVYTGDCAQGYVITTRPPQRDELRRKRIHSNHY